MADSALQNFANLKLRTDANGYLIVTFASGGTTIATASKYGFVGVSNAFGLSSTNTAIFAADGGSYLLVPNGAVFVNSAMLQFGSGGAADGAMHRLGAASFAFGTTTVGDFTATLKFTTLQLAGKVTLMNAVTSAGYGVPSIYSAGRVLAQTAANPTIATFTVGAADGSFEVSANMNPTVVTALATTLTCTYTDESNTARSMIFPVSQLSGSFIAAGAITGTGAWETPVMHIRAKAATVITILTSAGTFTSVQYTAEGIIKQTA